MMAYYYSISTAGWYDTDFANYALPEDVIELSEEVWNNLRSKMNTGKILKIVDGILQWVLPPTNLSELKQQKINELRNICTGQIERSSFSSAALGTVHNYDCRLVDQMNLKIRYDIANYNSSSEPIWASDGTRYEWKNHTSSQIIAVMEDMNNHIKDSQVRLAYRLSAVEAAETETEIMAIIW